MKKAAFKLPEIVFTPEYEVRAAKWEADRVEAERIRVINTCGVDARIADLLATGRDADGLPWVESEACKKISDGLRERSMVIAGGALGTGKSVAAAACLVDHGSGCFIRAADYCELAPWSPKAAAVRRTSFVVLDDLGCEREHDRMELFLETRYASKLPTVITTNLTSDAILERYTARLFERIKEATKWVRCDTVIRPRGTKAKKCPT